jgi:hypothetical protein
MLAEITKHLKEVLNNFNGNDSLIFNNKPIPISKDKFEEIKFIQNDKTIAFVDGGQAEILSAGNFCLSFIRIFSQVFKNNEKLESYKNEFYLLTTSKYSNNEIYYQSKIFPLNDKLVDEEDLFLSSTDNSISTNERAPISKIADIARRFAELALAREVKADFVVLDGCLDLTYKNEEKYIGNFNALAKSSSLFTISGNSPVVLLGKLGLDECWFYFVEGKTSFVKLHQNAKHIFRFEGDKEALPLLVKNSSDPLFLGYPYGLIFVDKFARVSNSEKKSLRMNFLLKAENKELAEYLSTTNAHDILDNLG